MDGCCLQATAVDHLACAGGIYTFAHLPGLQGMPLPLLLTHVDTVHVSILVQVVKL